MILNPIERLGVSIDGRLKYKMTKQRREVDDDEPTMLMSLKAPVEFFERLDRWCEQQQQQRGMTMKPSRPAAIRYIVHNFLLKQEQQRKRSRKRQSRSMIMI